MNKKQMVVLWLMVLVLSMAAVYEGTETHDTFVGTGVPVLLIGSTLLYQFRDRSSVQRISTDRLLSVVVGLLLIQTLLILNQNRSLKRSESHIEDVANYLGDINTRLSDVDDSISDIKSVLDDVDSDVQALQR